MESKLKIRTKCQEQDASGDEPASPTGQLLTSYIICVMESEIPIHESYTIEILPNLLLSLNPRFSSMMVSDRKGVKYWKRVEANPRDHIKILKASDGLSMEEYDDLFNKYLSKIVMEQLPKDRPLWEIHITKYPTSKAAGHLIFKLHHALGDGYSLMGALLSCLQRADNPSLSLTFPSLRSSSTAKTTKTNLINCVPRRLCSIYNTIRDFAWSTLNSSSDPDDKTPIRSGADNLQCQSVNISTVALSLDRVRNIKTKLQVTVNDVVTATICLGTRLYMQESEKGSGHSQSTALVTSNARNVSSYKSAQEMLQATNKPIGGNQVAILHVDIPKLISNQSLNPLDFIAKVHKTIKRKRNRLSLYVARQILEMNMKLRGPEAAAQFIQSQFKKSSFTCTNMIGPVEQMAVANHPCKGFYFVVASIPMVQNLVFTILSYMRTLRIGIVAVDGYIDLRKLRACIEKAFELIYEAAHREGREQPKGSTKGRCW